MTDNQEKTMSIRVYVSVVDFHSHDATTWQRGADGELTVYSADSLVAEYARGQWVCVEQVGG